MSTAEEKAGTDDAAWDEVAPDAARRLLVAAVDAFAERGYHATTTRDIAGRAGMSPAALYIHYKTKEELLHRISSIGHTKALEILEGAAGSPARPPSGCPAPCGPSSAGTPGRHATARVVQYELDALRPEHRDEIVALRRRSDAAVRRIIDEGVAAGEFDVADVPGTALAVLSLCIDVARWFNVKGRRSPEEVGDLYAGLVLRMVGADGSGAA